MTWYKETDPKSGKVMACNHVYDTWGNEVKVKFIFEDIKSQLGLEDVK